LQSDCYIEFLGGSAAWKEVEDKDVTEFKTYKDDDRGQISSRA